MLFALSEPISPSVTTDEALSQRLPQGDAAIKMMHIQNVHVDHVHTSMCGSAGMCLLYS